MTTLALTDIAFGFSSGHTTISKFRDTYTYSGYKTWGLTSWEALKTAYKAHKLCAAMPHAAIWTTFTLWAATYSISCMAALKEYAPYGCGAVYEPNSIVRHTPGVLVVTRVALTALEYTVQPRKAIVEALTMAVCAINLGYDSAIIDDYLPIAASITIFVFGNPLAKAFVVAETIGSLFISRSLLQNSSSAKNR